MEAILIAVKQHNKALSWRNWNPFDEPYTCELCKNDFSGSYKHSSLWNYPFDVLHHMYPQQYYDPLKKLYYDPLKQQLANQQQQTNYNK